MKTLFAFALAFAGVPAFAAAPPSLGLFRCGEPGHGSIVWTDGYRHSPTYFGPLEEAARHVRPVLRLEGARSELARRHAVLEGDVLDYGSRGHRARLGWFRLVSHGEPVAVRRLKAQGLGFLTEADLLRVAVDFEVLPERELFRRAPLRLYRASLVCEYLQARGGDGGAIGRDSGGGSVIREPAGPDPGRTDGR
jgi:hypothetical protein